MTIELNTTIAQAEVLFLSFAQLVADVDRRKAEELSIPKTSAIRRRGTGASGNPEHTNLSIPKLSDNLKELLNNGRT
jgi:TBC1 domain family member 15